VEGIKWNREQLDTIDLHWHDLRHEGASRLLAIGVDIRIIQLMLGHASLEQTQRYLNVTDEELRRGLAVSWQRTRGGDVRATVSVARSDYSEPYEATRVDSTHIDEIVPTDCHQIVNKPAHA
jgi:Phage integrase family